MTATTSGFGRALKELRLAAGLTQEALAERAGVSPRAVSDLERDPRRTPRLDTVALLSEALQLPPVQRAELLAAARPSEAAAPVGRGPVPRPLTPLIGRAGVAAALVELLERGETQLLTLTGPGGVGKTRLALDVLATVADQFADGVVFVDLAPLRDPNLVISAVAQQFRLDERAVPVAERLAAALRAKQVLVLLDNFEHLVDARTDLLTLLAACPGVTALVTSRVPLRVRGERTYRVAPLEVPRAGADDLSGSPAAQLFADRARAAGVELSPGAGGAVAEICRTLDGLPLAIELAAARVRLLPPDLLLRRLEQRLPVLIGGPHDLPDRQKTMRDAIAWSYQLLSERAAGLFRMLAVFVGGCSLEAVESISDDPSVADTLTELVDANLITLRHGEPAPRMTMLETIREYGLEQQQAAGETEAVARRHAEYFVARAERDRAAAETERDNLRAALNWALDNRDALMAQRLCGSVWWFWLERGHLAEGIANVRAALDLPAVGDVPATVRLAALTGAVKLIATSSVAEAEPWCERLVDLARQDGTESDLANALNTRGELAANQDRYADAARDHGEAVALAESSSDRTGHGAALIGLAYATFYTGDTRRAEVLAEQGLAATRATGSRADLAEAMMLLSWQATNAGKYETAHELATEGVEVFRALKDTGKIAEALRDLGINAQIAGNWQQAKAYLEQSHALFQERGQDQMADIVLYHLGHLAMSTGDLARARELGTQSLDSARRYADQWGIAVTTTHLGHVELAEGRIDAARAYFVESAGVFQAIGNPLYLAWCLEGLAGVAVADERWEVAAQLCAAREAVLTRIAAELPPMHPPRYRQTMAAVDNVLGAAGTAAARKSAADVPLAALVAATQAERAV